DLRILGGTEVEAVGHRKGAGPRDGDVAESFGVGQLGAGVGVQSGEPAIAVGGKRNTPVGVVGDPDHAGIVWGGHDRVAAHVTVVLLGDPGRVTHPGGTKYPQELRTQLGVTLGTGKLGRVIGLESILRLGALVGALIDRTLVGGGP